MYGQDGDDVMDGGHGRDKMFGDGGNDHLMGGLVGDVLQGGEGNDRLEGGDGDDSLVGGGGDDDIYGGEGNDFVDGSDPGLCMTDNVPALAKARTAQRTACDGASPGCQLSPCGFCSGAIASSVLSSCPSESTLSTSISASCSVLWRFTPTTV